MYHQASACCLRACVMASTWKRSRCSRKRGSVSGAASTASITSRSSCIATRAAVAKALSSISSMSIVLRLSELVQREPDRLAREEEGAELLGRLGEVVERLSDVG